MATSRGLSIIAQKGSKLRNVPEENYSEIAYRLILQNVDFAWSQARRDTATVRPTEWDGLTRGRQEPAANGYCTSTVVPKSTAENELDQPATEIGGWGATIWEWY